ncbi:MAG: citrate/2-methylcitrate synthase [Oscillospiraceae bacterium]|nr:citrate/2-methylcitrate synthase [Oscillospiraceae bacterium]
MYGDLNLINDIFIQNKAEELHANNKVEKKYFEKYEVKRGLRNPDGTGVLAGITHICNVSGYYIQDDEKVPIPGKYTYRGIDVSKLIEGFTSEDRFGYEETAYLLLFGKLPTREELKLFSNIMADYRIMPHRFTEDMILSAPSRNVMNKLERSILALYSYDPSPEPTGIAKELQQALQLVARCPVVVAHAYAAKKHYFDQESLYLHIPQPELSLAENFLYSIRPNKTFTREEAKILDLCLVLHAEHGGGNNSAFTCRVLSSAGTDIYSSIAAAVGSLKGPRHGGANLKVAEMYRHLKEDVKDWNDYDEIKAFLKRVLKKEAGDRSGLIYGMGHAIYTISDPRAVILKGVARDLAKKKGFEEEFKLYEAVEEITPQIFAEKGREEPICANVDMYSGLVYTMLGIPEELFTPLFAISRISGWCAHRIEEVYNPNKIIRPAYKAIKQKNEFIPLAERG